MKNRQSLKTSIAVSILWATITYSEFAFSLIVDFETTPIISNAPSSFGRAGPAQIIEVDNVLTFNGGLVLGFPTFLPTTPFITVPNFYATANHPSGGVIGHPTLDSTLSINIASSFGATSVEGVLLNGLNRPGSYTIEAFSNGTLVDSVSLNTLAPNLSSGFGLFKLGSDGLPITSVLFTPDLSDGEWDYFIDTIAINEPIENVVPLPASIWLFVSGVASILSMRKVRNHATS
jgi:hypothetical protein